MKGSLSRRPTRVATIPTLAAKARSSVQAIHMYMDGAGITSITLTSTGIIIIKIILEMRLIIVMILASRRRSMICTMAPRTSTVRCATRTTTA